MTNISLDPEFWFVANRVFTLLAAGAITVAVIKAVRRVAGRRTLDRSSRAEAGLWPRCLVWVAISVVMVPAIYLSGWVLAATLTVIGAQALREVWRVLRAAAARSTPRPRAIVRAAWMCAGVLWVGIPLTLILALRNGDGGFFLVAWIFVTIAVSDVVAMFAGMSFGRRHIFPTLSPGKTLEGTASGLVGALAGAALMRDGFAGVTPVTYYACTVLLFAGGVAGDLAASAFKRWAGVKDFGTALPGHGGVMDRLDSLLFAAPVAYLIADLLRSG